MYENNDNDCDNVLVRSNFCIYRFLNRHHLPFSTVSISGVYRSRRLSNFGSKHCLWIYTNQGDPNSWQKHVTVELSAAIYQPPEFRYIRHDDRSTGYAIIMAH